MLYYLEYCVYAVLLYCGRVKVKVFVLWHVVHAFCVRLVVMSEKEVMERRIKIRKKKMHKASVQLSSSQENMIQELLCGHRNTFDPAFSRFSGFRVRGRLRACWRARHFYFFKLTDGFTFLAYGPKHLSRERERPFRERGLSLADKTFHCSWQACTWPRSVLTRRLPLLLVFVILLQPLRFLGETREPGRRRGRKRMCLHCSSTCGWPHDIHDPGYN